MRSYISCIEKELHYGSRRLVNTQEMFFFSVVVRQPESSIEFAERVCLVLYSKA